MIHNSQFNLIALGGTFDHLHRGHRFILEQAFQRGEKVVIGMMSDEYVQRKFEIRNSKFEINFQIQNFKTRKKELEGFLGEKGWLQRAEIVKIENVYGGLDENKDIEAILVTKMTREGAEKINRERRRQGIRELEVVEVPMGLAEDGSPITSTRVREGEIDREGNLYKSKIKNQKSKINEKIRRELKKPQGELIKGRLEDKAYWKKKLIPLLKGSMVICVGDEVTRMANMINLSVQVYIFDYHIQRKKVFTGIEELGFDIDEEGIPFVRAFQTRRISAGRSSLMPLGAVKEVIPSSKLNSSIGNDCFIIYVPNPPGRITKELVEGVDDAVKKVIKRGQKQIIIVDGEEDLAAVPAILLAPLGAKVIYGQPAFSANGRIRRGEPNEGVVVVDVGEERKQSLMGILQ